MSINDEIRQSYNEYYSKNEMYERSDFFYEWLLSIADPPAGGSFLDVSCGEGHVLKQVELLRPNVRGIGIDISDVALSKAKTRVARSALVLGDAERLPFGAESFGCVANIGSLEHYGDRERAVAEMSRVLAPGGRAIVLVPNRYWWRDIWRAVRTGRGQLPTDQGREHTDSREGWKDLFREHGLDCDHVIKYERVARPTPTERTPRRMVPYAEIVPLNLCFSFVYVLRK